MSVPGAVTAVIDEDEPIDRVDLDDHRTLYLTPGQAITHRERSLLTEESVDTYPTDASRLDLEEGKKQVTVRFEYANQPSRELELPTATMAQALKALLASTIKATGTVAEDEGIRELYRFNELTVIVTDRRLFKHIGHALWADSFDVIEFEAVRDIRTEEGNVSTGINVDTTDGTDRLKVPHDAAEGFVTELERAVCDYHDIDAIGVLRGDPTAGQPDPEPDLDRLRPLSVGDEPTEATGQLFAESADEEQAIDPELLETLEALTEAIEEHQAQLAAYRDAIERIERELTRDQ